MERHRKKRPDNSVALINLSNGLFKKKEYQESYLCAKEAITINPFQLKGRILLCQNLRVLGNPGRALKYLKWSLDTIDGFVETQSRIFKDDAGRSALGNPDWKEIYCTLYSEMGRSYHVLKRYDEAGKMFEKALQMGISQAEVPNRLAMMLFDAGKPAEALAHFF